MQPLAELIWKNGSLVPWAEATTHVLTHGLHYGTSVFEGMRAYDTPNGPVGFRWTEHIQRLHDSGRMYAMEIPYSVEDLVAACGETVASNGLKEAYIRPVAYIGMVGMGVTPKQMLIDVAIAAFPWGAYLGEEGQARGVDVCVSSWARMAPNTVPTLAKMGGNYLSSYLIGREARTRGFAEGIGLGTDGRLSEGAGENLFLIKDGRILTPPSANSILGGITRDTVIKLAATEGWTVEEQALPREALYLADEVFMTGTAAEITPIRSIDGIVTKCGGPGPITKRLNALFRGLFTGETPDQWGWLEPIAKSEKVDDVRAAIAV
jgi:branched-chain amino acid aminotransferase